MSNEAATVREPQSERLKAGLDLMRQGVSLAKASLASGLSTTSLKMGWFRYVMEPEWRALKAGRSLPEAKPFLSPAAETEAEKLKLRQENSWLKQRIRTLESTPLKRESDLVAQLRQQIADLDEEAMRLGCELADRDLIAEVITEERLAAALRELVRHGLPSLTPAPAPSRA